MSFLLFTQIFHYFFFSFPNFPSHKWLLFCFFIAPFIFSFPNYLPTVTPVVLPHFRFLPLSPFPLASPSWKSWFQQSACIEWCIPPHTLAAAGLSALITGSVWAAGCSTAVRIWSFLCSASHSAACTFTATITRRNSLPSPRLHLRVWEWISERTEEEARHASKRQIEDRAESESGRHMKMCSTFFLFTWETLSPGSFFNLCFYGIAFMWKREHCVFMCVRGCACCVWMFVPDAVRTG